MPDERLRSPDQAGPEILPTDPRLSGSLDSGVADAQAEGNAPRPGRAAAGGSGGGVERPPGEPATAVAVAVVHDPLVDAKKNWTPPQKKMMAKAGRYHAVRGWSCRALGGGDVHGAGHSRSGRRTAESDHAAGWCRVCSMPTPTSASHHAGDGSEYRTWIDPLLHVADVDKAEATTSRQATPRQPCPVAGGRHASSIYLYGRLLDAEPHEVPVIRDALARTRMICSRSCGRCVEHRKRARNLNGCERQRRWRSMTRRARSGRRAARRGQRSGAGNPRVLGPVERGIPACEELVACSAGRHLPRSQRRSERNAPGNGPAGRLRCRQPASVGRPAHGRRREAVRRDLSEIQGRMASTVCPC